MLILTPTEPGRALSIRWLPRYRALRLAIAARASFAKCKSGSSYSAGASNAVPSRICKSTLSGSIGTASRYLAIASVSFPCFAIESPPSTST